MTDPATTALIAAGAKKLGGFAIDWVKGEPPEQLAAALAARISENDFQLLSFETLARDDGFWDFVQDVRQQFEFDDGRAGEIVRGHVGDVRGSAELDALVSRIVTLLRALLPVVVRGGSEAAGLQSALQHQDAVEIQRNLETNRQTLDEIRDAITALHRQEAAAAQGAERDGRCIRSRMAERSRARRLGAAC
jgi:hypothetical protein